MPDRNGPAATYDTSIFFNCPFDEAYKSLFEALVFAAFDCGYVPRCALEVDDAGQVRIEKILAIIRGCRLGVHDISRTELDLVNALPRFNMPFELGLFVGAARFGARLSPFSVSIRVNSSSWTNLRRSMSNTSRQRRWNSLSGLEPSSQ
jgi:hypothetical protein